MGDVLINKTWFPADTGNHVHVPRSRRTVQREPTRESKRTVTTLRLETAATPDGKRATDPEPVQARRTVRLQVLAAMREEADQASVDVSAARLPTPDQPLVRVRPRARNVPVSADDWLRIAEWVIGDWAATLRTALVVLVLFAGVLTGVGVAFGPEFALLGGITGAFVFLVGRIGGSGRR